MISPVTRFGAAALLAGALLPNALPANAAHFPVNPGSLPMTESWQLAEPAFTLIDEKDKARQRKITKPWIERNTRPLGTLKTSPDPPTRKQSPGSPNMQKVNPGVPAVQGR